MQEYSATCKRKGEVITNASLKVCIEKKKIQINPKERFSSKIFSNTFKEKEECVKHCSYLCYFVCTF